MDIHTNKQHYTYVIGLPYRSSVCTLTEVGLPAPAPAPALVTGSLSPTTRSTQDNNYDTQTTITQNYRCACCAGVYGVHLTCVRVSTM